MTKINGVVVGAVRDTKDPAGQGRVLVRFPWLPEDNESYWAPVATLMSGGERGSWFMPEKDDEVLVAFEHGNVDQPRVIGYLWNGVQKPPDDGGVEVRRLKTVAGHVLEFHDEDGGHKILLKTAGGQKLQLDDTSSTITIETSGGEQVKLSPGHVLASTSAGQAVELDDAPPSIIAKAGPGTVTIDESGVTVIHPGNVSVTAGLGASVTAGTTASVTAGAAMTLSAPVVTVAAPVTEFAGVVLAQTLIANAVVGAAYTPAPGNTFGL
jgi:uncharacterized protein involved in type VI secretion and phage assembly